MHLEELAVVNDSADDFVHVISLVCVVGDNLVQHVFLPVHGVGAFLARSLLHIVLRNELEQFVNQICCFFLGLGRKVCHTALG